MPSSNPCLRNPPSSWYFGRYILRPENLPIEQAFLIQASNELIASKVGQLGEKMREAAIAGNRHACVCGNAIMAHYAYPNHEKQMDESDVASRYAGLS